MHPIYTDLGPGTSVPELTLGLARHHGLAWAVAEPGCHLQTCPAVLAWVLWHCTSASVATAPRLLSATSAPGSPSPTEPALAADTPIDAYVPDVACGFVTSRVKPQQEIVTLCLQRTY